MKPLQLIEKILDRTLRKTAKASRKNYVLWSIENDKKFTELKDEINRQTIIQADQFLRDPEVKEKIEKRLGHEGRIITDADKNAVREIVKAHYPPLREYLSSDILLESYIWFANRGGQAALDKRREYLLKKSTMEATFNLKNKDVIGWLMQRAKLLIDSVDETTKDWLMSQIIKGEEKQLSWVDIANKIREKIPDYYKGRAENIVHTEMAEIVNRVELETAIRNEAATKIWRAAGMNICDDCQTNNGKEVGASENFPSGNFRPPSHCRCKCLLEYTYPVLGTFGRVWSGED